MTKQETLKIEKQTEEIKKITQWLNKSWEEVSYD